MNDMGFSEMLQRSRYDIVLVPSACDDNERSGGVRCGSSSRGRSDSCLAKTTLIDELSGETFLDFLDLSV